MLIGAWYFDSNCIECEHIFKILKHLQNILSRCMNKYLLNDYYELGILLHTFYYLKYILLS